LGDNVKFDNLYIAAIAVIAFLYVVSAHAGPPQYGGNVTIGGPTTVKNDVHPNAFSSSTGIGGDGGAGGQGGSVSAPISTTSSTSVNTRAYGGGSTGLTGTARCLQSFGVAFNAVSGTYVDKDCIAMVVAEELCGEGDTGLACKRKVACANPSVPDYAKEALGCAR
jgi:hypothetical protein